MNAKVALEPKGFQIIKDSSMIDNAELSAHVKDNSYDKLIDLEDPANKHLQIMALYYSDNDLT